MSFPKDDNELDAALAEAFTPPPEADFDAWQRQHPEAVAWLNPRHVSAQIRRRMLMKRTVIFAAAAAAAICVWLGIGVSHSIVSGPGDMAFGQILSQIENAQTITWKLTEYSHATSRDGKTTWLVTNTSSLVYRSPGLLRKVGKGYYFGTRCGRQYTCIHIEDRVHGKSISLFPEKKQATITERQPLTVEQLQRRGVPSPQFHQKILKDGNLQWLEKRTLPTGEVAHVFRNTERDEDNKRYRSHDFWVDAKSKRLVKINFNGPQGELYDPEKDPIRNNPLNFADLRKVGIHVGSLDSMGCVWHDIVFDAKVDDSLFSLQPPEGYTVKYKNKTLRMTEQNMLEYLGVFVEFHDQMFPDQAIPPYPNFDKLNAAREKPVRKLTAIEKKYLALFDHYKKFGLYSPFHFFHVSPDVIENSFRYVGKGVKLGDKDAIVCWYKLKDAKDPNTYRAVYGDLSVKDVAAEDLPLPVAP